MGTNYYWVPGTKDKCKPLSKVHIGKHSGGWQFSFKAHRVKCGGTEAIRVGEGLYMAVDVPALELMATSWQEWRKLLARSGHIEDEYGQVVPLTDFIQMVEVDAGPNGKWNGKPLLNHVLYTKEHHPSAYSEDRYWQDAAGHVFCMPEFS